MPKTAADRQAEWYKLREQRWGPSLDHNLPGIVIDPGSPSPTVDRLWAISALSARDPHAKEERAAIRECDG